MRKIRRFLWFGLLCLVIVACQGSEEAEPTTADDNQTAVPAATGTPAEAIAETQPTNTPLAETATPTTEPAAAPLPTRTPLLVTYEDETTEEIAALLPINFSAYIAEGVELGLWAEVEGMLTVFGYLMGQAEKTAVPRIDDVGEWALTGLLRSFRDKIAAGELTAEQIAEYDAYYKILLPSAESLELFSEPEGTETGGMKPPGLAALASQSDCSTMSSTGFPAEDHAGRACFKYTEFEHEGVKHRVYYPIGSEEEQKNIKSYADTIQTALKDSVNTFEPFGTLRSVHILVRPQLARETEDSITLAHQIPMSSSSTTCNLVFFKGSFTSTSTENLDELKQTTAHEIFHCFQDWNFTTAPYDTHQWWLEGSAEYFSNLVYPLTDDEHRYFGDFSTKSTKTPVTDMAYENAVFFQHLGTRLGDDGLISLLKKFTGGKSDHIRAMAGIENMDGIFNEFVVLLMSRGVPDTSTLSTYVFNKIKVTKVVRIDEEKPYSFEPAPFVAARYSLRFKKERLFEQENEETKIRHSAVEKGLHNVFTNWSSMPEELRTECDKKVTYLLAATAVETSAEYKLEVNKVEEASCDPCLLGTWDIDPEKYATFMEGLMTQFGGAEAAGISIDITITGHNYVQFMDDGRFTTQRDAFGMQFNVPGMGPINNVTNSSGSGRYTADGEILTAVTLNDVISDVSGNINMGGGVEGSFLIEEGSSTFFGGGTSVTIDDDGGLNNGVEKPDPVGYVCTDETLVMIHPTLGEMSYLRVDEILPTPVPTAAAP